MVRGLYAGSFDPPHLGHIEIAEAAASRCSHLWIATVGNPSKATGLFSLDQRRDFLETALQHVTNVEVVAYDGLLVRLAEDLGVDVFFRGASKEFSNELVMASMNEQMSGRPTLFLAASAIHANLSSRSIRQLFRYGGAAAVRNYVPAVVFDALSKTASGPIATLRPQVAR